MSQPPPFEPPPFEPAPGWQPPPPAWQPPTPPPAWQPPAPPSGWQQQAPPPVPPGSYLPAPIAPVPVAPAPKGRGRLVAGTVAIVVLAGGGVASYAAFSDSSGHGGAGSPKAAVQQIFDDLNHSDFIGLLNDLAPGEKTALATPVQNEINQYKRLNVLRNDADPSHLSAISFAATGLTYADSTVAVSDSVQIVRLTGGRITINVNPARLPLSAAFIKAAFRDGRVPATSTGNRTLDIGALARQSPDKELQIATERVNGRWYPSVFYTIAYYATRSAGVSAPSPADRIPAIGAGSPEAAVKEEINALASLDVTRAIQLVSPDELQALHDYGKLIVDKVGPPRSASFTIKSAQFSTTSLPDGVRVGLKSIDVQTKSTEATLAVLGSCADVTVSGHSQSFCADNVPDLIAGGIGRFRKAGAQLTGAQRTAVEHLFTALLGVGVDTTQVNGQWFVNPARTVLDLSGSVLSGLQGDDLLQLVSYFTGH